MIVYLYRIAACTVHSVCVFVCMHEVTPEHIIYNYEVLMGKGETQLILPTAKHRNKQTTPMSFMRDSEK